VTSPSTLNLKERNQHRRTGGLQQKIKITSMLFKTKKLKHDIFLTPNNALIVKNKQLQDRLMVQLPWLMPKQS
jgi:hypothetical protein